MYRNIIYAFIFVFLTSCYTTKKSVYFREINDTTISSKIEREAPVIQKSDLLSISVGSLNPHASEIFNNTPSGQGAHPSTVSGSITQSFGYLVDEEGYIQFPILGNIKAEGLSPKALKDTIHNQILLRKLLLDPIVSIRYLNFKISVLGEVDKPSVYNIPNEKITLLEALALAGDMTIYARRDNVLLIREENKEKKLVRINLRSSEIFSSPYYYLKSNDIIYVEPNKAKVASTRPIAPWLSVIFSASSLVVVILTRVQ